LTACFRLRCSLFFVKIYASRRNLHDTGVWAQLLTEMEGAWAVTPRQQSKLQPQTPQFSNGGPPCAAHTLLDFDLPKSRSTPRNLAPVQTQSQTPDQPPTCLKKSQISRRYGTAYVPPLELLLTKLTSSWRSAGEAMLRVCACPLDHRRGPFQDEILTVGPRSRAHQEEQGHPADQVQGPLPEAPVHPCPQGL
jgi:hypothetical protein